MARRDEDALTWDGDDDPTLAAASDAEEGASADRVEPPTPESEPPHVSDSPARSERQALPEGWSAVGRGSDSIDRRTGERSPSDVPADTSPSADGAEPSSVADPAPSTPPTGNAALVSLGVLGGAYLLFAIGWLIGGLRLQGRAPFLVTDVMYQASLWIAVLAPLIWFGTVLVVLRGKAPWLRFVWLAAGIVLLVPWPFVYVGAVGAL